MKVYESIYRASAKHEAQAQLAGRTHYVDDSTLRYFNCRILAVRRHFDGYLLSIIERLPCGSFNGPKKSRFVCFDVAGNVINDKERNGEYATTKQAEKARDAYIASLTPADVLKITAAAIIQEEKQFSRAIDENSRFYSDAQKRLSSTTVATNCY